MQGKDIYIKVKFKIVCNILFFSGYLHGHVSYLSDDCQACLLLLTVDRDAFFTLSEAKQKISEVRINPIIFGKGKGMKKI
jgi:hypothetical protein